MIMENCVMNLRDNCRDCSDWKACVKRTELIDRKGVSFPVYTEYFHRCQIFNSVPTFTADRPATEGVSFKVIFITNEKDSVATVSGVLKGEINSDFTRKG
jgi:hypothetical protein